MTPAETQFAGAMWSARERELHRLRRMQFPALYPKHTPSQETKVYAQQRVIRTPAQGGITSGATKRVFYGQ